MLGGILLATGVAATRRPIFFLHVSNSGGTSACQWAMAQPCGRVPACGANCNLGCRHPWDWRNHCRPPSCEPPAKACRPPHRLGCAGLLRHAQKKNLTFIASETLLTEHCFDSFDYVTVLRDPVSRLRSQLERRSAHRPNARLRSLLSQPRVFNVSASSSLMGTAAIDNYLIRLLVGPSAFFLPLGGINSTHLHTAVEVLNSFAIAIPIENFTDRGAAWLRAVHGWEGAPTLTNRHKRLQKFATKSVRASNGAGGTASKGRSTTSATAYRADSGRRLAPRAGPMAHERDTALSERNKQMLRALNRYDLKLLEFARRQFARDVAYIERLEEMSSRASRTTLPQGRARARCTARQCPIGKVSWSRGNLSALTRDTSLSV